MPLNATPEISETQGQVMERLLLGDTVTAAAEAGQVCRETVHRWLRADFNFQAELNRRRTELQDQCRARLLQASVRAAQTVDDAIASGNVKVALAVLRGLGALDGKGPRIASDDPALIESRARAAGAEQEREIVLNEMIALTAPVDGD